MMVFADYSVRQSFFVSLLPFFEDEVSIFIFPFFLLHEIHSRLGFFLLLSFLTIGTDFNLICFLIQMLTYHV